MQALAASCEELHASTGNPPNSRGFMCFTEKYRDVGGIEISKVNEITYRIFHYMKRTERDSTFLVKALLTPFDKPRDEEP